MPNKAEKLLDRMRHSKGGWKRKDLEALYTGFGFIIKNSGAPHDTVVHPDYPELITSLPRHTKLAIYIVNQAIHMIDRLKLLEMARKEEESRGNQL